MPYHAAPAAILAFSPPVRYDKTMDSPTENANRQYKDSLFTALFNTPDAARELYNAVSGGAHPADTPVIIKTLPNIFYRALKNDLAFLLGDILIIFIEHQSTVNPNMALRMLLYAAEVYKTLLNQDALYGKKILIPRPKFYVLYNGTDDLPDVSEQRLSGLFQEAAGRQEIDLELTVRIYNINEGHNETLMAKCGNLRGYAQFVAQVQENLGPAEALRGLGAGERRAALAEAIRRAIRYSISHDILKEFLEKNAGEVENMLTAEFDLNIAERVWKEQAWEEGLKRGRGIGLEEGLVRGRGIGREEGLVQGRGIGLEEGLVRGRGIGREEGLVRGAQNKQLEILALMEQVENLEDFRRLQAQLKGTDGNTRTVQS